MVAPAQSYPVSALVFLQQHTFKSLLSHFIKKKPSPTGLLLDKCWTKGIHVLRDYKQIFSNYPVFIILFILSKGFTQIIFNKYYILHLIEYMFSVFLRIYISFPILYSVVEWKLLSFYVVFMKYVKQSCFISFTWFPWNSGFISSCRS